MKIIETSKPLLDFKGVQLKEGEELLTVGAILSNILSYVKSTNPSKSYVLAKKFALEKTVELKADDIVFIRQVVNESKYFPLMLGQILEEIGE